MLLKDDSYLGGVKMGTVCSSFQPSFPFGGYLSIVRTLALSFTTFSSYGKNMACPEATPFLLKRFSWKKW